MPDGTSTTSARVLVPSAGTGWRLVRRVEVVPVLAMERAGRIALEKRCFAVPRLVDANRGVEVADLQRTALAAFARAPQEAVHVLYTRTYLLDNASEFAAAARARDRRAELVHELSLVHLYAHGPYALHRDAVLAAAARREFGGAVQDEDVIRAVPETIQRIGEGTLLHAVLVKQLSLAALLEHLFPEMVVVFDDCTDAILECVPVRRLAVVGGHLDVGHQPFEIPPLEPLLPGVQAGVREILGARKDGLAGEDVTVLVDPHDVEEMGTAGVDRNDCPAATASASAA